MKVLLFTNLFPSPHEPTRALFNLRRFQALARFCEVRVVVPVPFRKRLKRPRELFHFPASSFGGLSVSYPTNWAIPRVLPQLHAEEMYRSIRRHVRSVRTEFRFDAILAAFAYPDAVVAARLATDFGVPFVAIVMGSDINDLAQRPPLRNQIAAALRQARSVVALSSALKAKVVALGLPDNSVMVQRNGVDGTQFTIRDRNEERRALGIAGDAKILCFIGNLVREKGPDLLIEALAHIGRRDIHAVFVGDGDMKAELNAKVEQLGLRDRVLFAGRRGADEIPRWIAAADVLCLPSRREGCPNVVLEALACGRPVVACEVGGVPELLSSSNGVIVPPENASAFGKGIESALGRSWDPAQLRESVPSLTWNDFGRSVHDALALSRQDVAVFPSAPTTLNVIGTQ